MKKKTGRHLWKDLILKEASAKIYVIAESPKRGTFPNGAYHSSRKVDNNFFTRKAKETREKSLVEEEMPFLHNLLLAKLTNRIKRKQESGILDDDDVESACSNDSLEEISFDNENSSTVEPTKDYKKKESLNKRETRAKSTAKTICAMVAFGENRRANSMQLWNSVIFVACGVTERINSYLHYIGLTMSRKTGLSALVRLSDTTRKTLASQELSIKSRKPISPFICIDNIDFEERIHFQSVEKTSHMFHGTWGYVHTLDPTLIEGHNPKDFSLDSYKQAIKDSAKLKITPPMFMPTFEEEIHFRAAIKSQIAQVMMTYIATTDDPKKLVPLESPTIDQITAKKPQITMLKLMLASDNCAEGVGKIFSDIIDQTYLTPEQFFSELQVMEGDLGTIMNLECLRSQRKPSGHKEESLGNIFMLLGAAHTLWNIGQAIFLKHFGNNKNQDDLGAWRTLQALGLPSEKPAAKKDFTLMLTNMQKIHEATLIHCLLLVMGIPRNSLPNEKLKLTAKSINHAIDLCYTRFFGCTALQNADKSDSPKLFNLMTRLRDFATVIEANRAMKAGDIGRLLNIWRRWSVMAQGITGLTHYAIHLPRMILLITKVLPPALCHAIQHSLLVTPSGRPGHFVAKDFLLETFNYWLKFMFNKSGIGTKAKRLRDLFSSNVPLLQRLIRSIKEDSGACNYYQSHKHQLTLQSINAFLRMAITKSIGDNTDSTKTASIPAPALEKGKKKTKKKLKGKDIDIMRRGMEVMQNDALTGGTILNRFRPSETLLNPSWMFDEASSLPISPGELDISLEDYFGPLENDDC
ncbi:hypothetical protein PGTUg99_020757 [Puccinia graminis f. sp. tritici]|nr:hypothetical protein PGTUg99_020757 [Puccinia graminis f. sp. tritici]